ncbi:DEKNAAC103042 [Brettanomyces naardenensis]|uniref:DEKNAAC103042 n=1 Tax=Brettanomyces naardenensis TaxID=13370 RepID=A0A448YMC9_BRENA|nr:DEKNAAC103042 [Brettanomyces naardenensis]
MSDEKKYKDAFALFDKKGTGQVAVSQLGDLLRAIGQNPTLQEISELQASVGGESSTLSYDKYVKLINREGGFKKVGQPEDYIKAFQIFDKNLTGYIGVGELKYILTSIGEKLSEDEVDELLKGISITDDNTIDYVEFVKSILAQ